MIEDLAIQHLVGKGLKRKGGADMIDPEAIAREMRRKPDQYKSALGDKYDMLAEVLDLKNVKFTKPSTGGTLLKVFVNRTPVFKQVSQFIGDVKQRLTGARLLELGAKDKLLQGITPAGRAGLAAEETITE